MKNSTENQLVAGIILLAIFVIILVIERSAVRPRDVLEEVQTLRTEVLQLRELYETLKESHIQP